MYHHFNLLILLCCYGLIIYGIIEKDETRKLTVLIIGASSIFVYPIIMEIIYNLIAKLCCPKERPHDHLQKHERVYKMKIPICYSQDYNIKACGLEKCHPFDSCKYERVFEQLTSHNIISKESILVPDLPARSDLLEVMSPYYMWKLNYSLYISKCVELPICFMPGEVLRYQLLNPMMKASQGSIEGACLALEHGWAINLSGGYHHASNSSGGGFCIYPDITLAIHHLRKWHSDVANRVMIIDLDAHQGNGHERDFLNDSQTFIIDCYNRNIYPADEYAKNAIAQEIHVSYRHSDEEYLQLISEKVKNSIRTFLPNFIVYNAGTDCMRNDPLGNLNLSEEGIIQRDELIFSIAFEEKIPILMVLSGGYQKTNAPVIADSIENIVKKFSLINKL